MLPCLKIFFAFFFLSIACCQLPTCCFAQSITFEKYYDTLGCYYANCVEQTYDGGYIAVGSSYNVSTQQDAALLRTDSLGNVLWVKTYGGPNTDGALFVEELPDSGLIISGLKDDISTSDSKLWLLRTDKNGDTIWTKTIISGVGANRGYCVHQTTDGGYIISGYTSGKGAGSYDVFLVKTNSVGDTTWTKTYGGTDVDAGTILQQTTDGGYIITGYTFSFNPGQIDAYLIKTNSMGDTLWTKVFRGNNNQTRGFSVQQTIEGGYVIAGIISMPPSNYLVSYLIKTNTNGDTLWTKKYDTLVSNNAYSVQQTNDGGYMIIGDGAGTAQQGAVYLVRTNSIGDTLWTKSYGTGGGIIAWYGTLTSDGGCIITGSHPTSAIYLLKTDSTGFAITGIYNPVIENSQLYLYPNPFFSSATLVIPEGQNNKSLYYEIYNILGNCVRKIAVNKGEETLTIQKNDLRAGIYFLKLYSDQWNAVIKIIIQ